MYILSSRAFMGFHVMIANLKSSASQSFELTKRIRVDIILPLLLLLS